MHPVAEIEVDPERCLVYEHGWQSWSPTQTYRLGDRPLRPVSDARRIGNYRPDRSAPEDAFWGEGLLAVDPGTGGPVHLVAAADPTLGPSIRADHRSGTLLVSAEPGVTAYTDDGPGGIPGVLARWADGFAAAAGVSVRPAPSLWCSWYHYFTRVTEADILENLKAIDDLELDVEVVQIDDGYQAELGDWLTLSTRFRSLTDIVGRIHDRGRRAGIWVAPYLVGHRSATFRDRPEVLLPGIDAGHGWDQDLAALDAASPAGEDYLREVFEGLAAAGFDFYKLDFLYAGAIPGPRSTGDTVEAGIAAYRRGLQVIRESVGPAAYLLGCGAPMLPSVGLVDGMRVGPDISHHFEPADGDQSQPSQRAAVRCGRERAWQSGRFWANDPDCLIASVGTEQRESWAEHVGAFGGLRGSSDRLVDLDDWGLAATRRLVRPRPATPLVSSDTGRPVPPTA